MPTSVDAGPKLPSYTSGVSDRPLLGDTIGANFDRAVAAFGDRDALVDHASDRRWTYRELAADVDAVALGLLASGVRKGDRVGIWAPNCPEWVLVQYATARIGAILVNINPAYRAHELEFVLNQAGVRSLVAAAGFKTSDYAAMIDQVRPNCPDLLDVILLGRSTWEDLAASGRDADRGALETAQAALSADDPINIQYTLGTTGFPKGATLSHHNILNRDLRAALARPREAERKRRHPDSREQGLLR
jgi:fatty-acyl-CoA synthase